MADENKSEPSVTNYASNSHKSKDEAATAKQPQPTEKKVTKVVINDASLRKKPLGTRVREMFTGDDARSTTNFIIIDVVVPAIKDMISASVREGVDRFLYGGEYRPRSSASTQRRTGGPVSYHRMSTSPTGRAGEADGPRSGSSRRQDWSEIVTQTRPEAEDIIDRLVDLIQNYDSATVADLYELAGITGSYTDNKWGWIDARGFSIRSLGRDGYLVVTPRPISLD